MATQSIDLHELFQYVRLEIHATWRYRWRALIVAWCVMIVGALLVFSLPNKYAASAQVYADTEALTNPLLHGVAVQPDVRGRLQIITHTLLSRPNLETVADKTGLSLRETDPSEKDAVLEQLGASVRIDTTGTRDLYKITYADPDREMAQKVVQAFLDILMNDTLGANSAANRTAQNFLRQQVDDYGTRLTDAENKLAAYERANVGFIPSQGGASYFTRLQAAETRLQDLKNQYATAVAGRAITQQEMRSMASGPRSTGIDPASQAIDAQIAAYQKHLDQLLLRYTNEYPDVVSTRRMISQLRARRDAMKKGAVSGSMLGVVSDNPVYQEMQKSLYTSEVNLQTLQTQIALQQKQVDTLKSQADKITGVQAGMQQLNRNYDVTKRQYDELVSRLNTAQLSEDAAQSGNNLKFRVVDPPFVPLKPASPKRVLLLLVVFVLALGIGAGFAWFLHKIQPVFVTIKGLRDSGEYPVLGALSLIVSDVRRGRRRREIAGFFAGAALLAAVLVVGITFDAHLTALVQQFFVMRPI